MRPKAQGYSDFYKNNDSTPNTNDDDITSDDTDPVAKKKARKLALKRRLQMRKAG